MAKTKKESMYMKEDEEAKKAVDETAEEENVEHHVAKKPVEERDGKLIKEDESEAEDEDEEEDEDAMNKDTFGGETPEESAEISSTEGHTTTSKPLIGNRQHVLVPNSNVAGTRNASPGSFAGGQSPSEVSYAGKSVEADLLKSPLYVNLSKQLASFEKAMQIKVDAMIKSFEARFENLNTAFKALENMPLRKALNEDISGTVGSVETFEKKIESGKIKYR